MTSTSFEDAIEGAVEERLEKYRIALDDLAGEVLHAALTTALPPAAHQTDDLERAGPLDPPYLRAYRREKEALAAQLRAVIFERCIAAAQDLSNDATVVAWGDSNPPRRGSVINLFEYLAASVDRERARN